MAKTAIQFFHIILVGAIGAGVIGSCFAAVIGLLAPEFVDASKKDTIADPEDILMV